MDWYPWYFTLYEQHTMHLDPYQDGCYRRLIDHYMKTRAPLPDNDQALARIIGISYENWMGQAAAIIRPFFKPDGAGNLLHNRCDRELHYQDSKTRHLSESGKKGAEARIRKINNINALPSTPQATLKPPLSLCLSTGQDRTVQEKERIPPKPPKGNGIELPEWMPVRAWDDFCKHRGNKFTENAKRLAIAKLDGWRKLGHDPAEILNESVMNGWKGLFEPKKKHGKETRETLGYTPLGVGG